MVRRSKRRTVRALSKQSRPGASKMFTENFKMASMLLVSGNAVPGFFIFFISCPSLYFKTHYTSTRSKCFRASLKTHNASDHSDARL